MTNKQSKGHWWIVENIKDISITPKSRYLDICFIIGGLLELDDSQKSSVLPSIIESTETEPLKPLTQCMVGRDAECNYPQCPVTEEDVKNGKYCELPVYDLRQ